MPSKESDGFRLPNMIVDSARVDRDGEWKITFSIPACDGPMVAAMALQNQTVFEGSFKPVK